MLVKKRVILYAVSFLALLAISFSTILILKGYYFDFETWRLKKNGSVFIRSIPRSANILIDGKIKKKRSPININLGEGKYSLRIEKDGFIPWEKEISIQSGFVTWEYYVFLIRENRNEKILSDKSVKQYLVSPDSSKVAFIDNEGSAWFLDVSSKNIKKVYTRTSPEESIAILDWSRNNNSILLSKVIANENNYSIISEQEIVNLPHVPKENKKAQFKENSDKEIFVLSSDYLYSVNKDRAAVVEDGVSDFSQTSSYVFYAKNNVKSEIWRAGFDMNGKNKISEEEIQITTLIPGNKGVHAFINKNKEIKLIENGQTKKLTGNATFAFWSQEEKRLLYGNGGEVRMYVVKQEDPREENDLLITRLSTPIEEIKWFYDEGHIIYRIKNDLTFVGIDGTNSVNLYKDVSAIPGFATTKYGRELIFTQDTKDGPRLVYSQIGEENGLIPY